MIFQILPELSVAIGKLFHKRGPVTAKLLSPNLVRGTVSVLSVDERRVW